MFEFGRELKRFFHEAGPREGLTDGDSSLLELLDLDLLKREIHAIETAVARAGVKDRPRRLFDHAMALHELARRTGDAVALRRAAAAAERAAGAFEETGQAERCAEARMEQALCALLGAELFGEQGLDAAAGAILKTAPTHPGAAPALAATAALIEARSALREVEPLRVAAAVEAFAAPIAALETQARRRPASRLRAASARGDRAELLAAFGVRRADAASLRAAIDGLDDALAHLDPDYEPLTWARLATLRGAARGAAAQIDADIAEIAEAVNDLVAVLESLIRSHSPLDWARAQEALAGALQMLGEATDSDRAFDQAIACQDRALTVLGGETALAQRAGVAYDRAVCLARRAELRGDLAAIAEAETALLEELAGADPEADPVGWAVRQLNLARLYEARIAVRGKDRGERAAAAEALSSALEVFGEHGHRALADLALRGLARLRCGSPRV